MTRELEKVIKTKSSEKVMIASGKKGFIFKVSLKSSDGYPDSIHYEVFRRVVKPVCDFIRSKKNDGYDDYVVYPSDEDFGKWAWCCTGKEYAFKMAKKLLYGQSFELTDEQRDLIFA